MARIASQLGILALILMSILVAFGLLLAATVAWLEPFVGLAGALALVGAAFLFIALMLILLLGALTKARRKRQRTMDGMGVLVELVLILMPNRYRQRIEAGVAAAAGLAVLVAALVPPSGDVNAKDG